MVLIMFTFKFECQFLSDLSFFSFFFFFLSFRVVMDGVQTNLQYWSSVLFNGLLQFYGLWCLIHVYGLLLAEIYHGFQGARSRQVS